jgi:hypothetical protein
MVTVFLSILQMKHMFLLSSSLVCFSSLSCANVSMMIPNKIFTMMMITRMWKVQSNTNFTKNLFSSNDYHIYLHLCVVIS